MTANLTLILTASALVGCGVYLLLARSLTQVLVGLVMLSNGVNLCLLIAGGAAGRAPLVGLDDPGPMSDPLSQALVLTAIVITLGTTAFLLALAYRSWQLAGNDDVQDDVEDAVVRRLARADQASQSYGLTQHGAEDSVDEPAEERGA